MVKKLCNKLSTPPPSSLCCLYFFPNPEPSSTFPLNLTSLFKTKLGKTNRELSVLQTQKHSHSLSLSTPCPTSSSQPTVIIHICFLIMHEAWGEGEGGRVSVKNPDLKARRKVETNEEDEQTRGEEARCATPSTKPNTQVQKGKRNKGRLSECRSVQCRSSDDGR